MGAVLRALADEPGIDVVHDHVEVVGVSMLAALGSAAPPTLQTLHWDLGKHRRFYDTFDGRGRVAFAAVSESQRGQAPPNLRRQVIGVVPLASEVPGRPPDPAGEHVLCLGRLTPTKGYDVAARACTEVGQPLVIAGPVGGLADRAALDAALADERSTVRTYADVRWFREALEPLVDGRLVRWIGAVGGTGKEALLRSARAVLCPLRWEEPGGTAIVEAQLAGVPVVGFRRGCLPSLVDHGVTGFVVDTEDELAAALRRLDTLDRDLIAARAADRFAPERMAEAYVALYRRLIARDADGDSPVTAPPARGRTASAMFTGTERPAGTRTRSARRAGDARPGR
jgi:glycosyltransferase involved in cell wall biosynthesis